MHDHRVTQINVLLREATDQHFHEGSAFFSGHPACRKYQRCEDTTVDLVDPFAILPLLFTSIGGELTPDLRTRSQAVLWVCIPNIKEGILLPGPEATYSIVDTSLQRPIRRSSRQVFGQMDVCLHPRAPSPVFHKGLFSAQFSFLFTLMICPALSPVIVPYLQTTHRCTTQAVSHPQSAQCCQRI